jgi:hypothetical protein
MDRMGKTDWNLVKLWRVKIWSQSDPPSLKNMAKCAEQGYGIKKSPPSDITIIRPKLMSDNTT